MRFFALFCVARDAEAEAWSARAAERIREILFGRVAASAGNLPFLFARKTEVVRFLVPRRSIFAQSQLPTEKTSNHSRAFFERKIEKVENQNF